MNSLLGILAVVLPFNISNFTTEGPGIWLAFDPYMKVLPQDMFWGVMLLIVVVVMFVQSERNIFLTGMVMMVLSTVFVGLLPSAISLLFFVISGLVIAGVLKEAFTTVRGRR